MRLSDRVAVVTGAAAGIGRAIALRFAREGAHVIVSDVHSEPSAGVRGEDATASQIEREGGSATYVTADVSDWAQVDNLVRIASSEFGRLDVMVNNAAVFGASSVINTSELEWDRLMSVNLRGQFLCCKRAVQEMLKQDPVNEVRGRIINIASQHGMVGPPEFFAYAVSKGGVVQMTRQLAVDYGPRRIIVNAVAPGRIITGTHEGDDDPSGPETEYSRSRTPFFRLGRPQDVAGAALFLASDDSGYVSGHHLLVDGG
jgi:glucose 1-dehydrogenase